MASDGGGRDDHDCPVTGSSADRDADLHDGMLTTISRIKAAAESD